MKSRTSYFNLTVFRKNLTRFAPAWGLYTIFLLLALVSLIDGGSVWFASNLCDFVQILCFFTPCYTLLCVQLLFGDLYNSRMCNALHALPMKRETWFVTNVTSGFVFHLIPTAIFAILAGICTLFCSPGDWKAAAMWLLGVNLQFICFFGIAVFSAFCVGNRFAQAVIYGILNFGAAIVGWMLDTIIIPMYHGIQLNLDPILWFCPLGQMIEADFYSFHYVDDRYDESTQEYIRSYIGPGENFLYYFIVAAVGIALIFLALRLYRRRNLECAGDFIAIPALAPVFQVVYTLIVGCVFHFIADDLFGFYSWFFPFLGLAVGWFTGKMLLERTPRVFQLKSFLRCGALMVAYTLTLTVAALDPFGIESWVPETKDVESIILTDGHWGYQGYHEGQITLEDPVDIEKIISMHQNVVNSYHKYGIEAAVSGESMEVQEETTEYTQENLVRAEFSMSLTITYQLKNGRTVSRYYIIWMGSENGKYLQSLFSSPEAVLGHTDAVSFLEENSHLCIRDTYGGKETNVHSQADIRGLYEAILADCEAGTMAQSWNFHNADHNLYWFYFDSGLEITVFSNCENTLNWLRDYGLDVDQLIERRNEFG